MKKHSAILALGLGLTLTVGAASAQQQGTQSPLPADYVGDSVDIDPALIMGGPSYGGNKGFIYTGEPPAALGGGEIIRTIFLNNCQNETTPTGTAGCTIFGGGNDSRQNRSSIVSGTRGLTAYNGSDANWNAIVACVAETYAPFNVIVTDVDPGPNVPHYEAMAAGLPTNVGMPNGVAGVAPFTCGVINNAITFSFLNLFPSDIDQACWTIAQETAHAFGLSHEMLEDDPMTYIQNPPEKRFQNESACVGTQGCCQPSGECQCQQQQNSVMELLAIFGPSNPTPPNVVIETPTDNSQVTPGFVVRAAVTDPQGVGRVEFLFDNELVTTVNSPPYAFNAPIGVVDGTHLVTIRAFDTANAMGSTSVTVFIGEPCTGNADCAAEGADLVCVDGRCVAGENTPGGLGSDCSNGELCLSGLCATKDGENKCSEECNPSANGCPDGYACLDNGIGGGLCWPGDGGVCGCATGGGGADPSLPIGAGVLIAALLVRRRRQRPTAV